MSSLAMSSFVEQQIVLHQFTAKHCAQARVMLGWSREALARQAGVAVQAIEQLEDHGDVDDETRLILAFRLEAEGLVFFPGVRTGVGDECAPVRYPGGATFCTKPYLSIDGFNRGNQPRLTQLSRWWPQPFYLDCLVFA